MFVHKLMWISKYVQNECETYYLNRIIGSYYGSRDPDVLHVSLKEYAANIHVTIYSALSRFLLFCRMFSFPVVYVDTSGVDQGL